jgi:GMP synthase-like glutamine amidotransferase
MSRAPFLILETGDPVMPLRRHGGFGHWIRIAAGLAGGEFVARRVHAGDELPDHHGWAGVLVSGSGAMVTDRADWSERAADWLRHAHARGLPMLGICYGHQLIAHALGGEVDWHPAGREMGTVEVRLEPGAQADPLFAGLPERFPAQTSHLQTVLQGLPPWRAQLGPAVPPRVLRRAHARLHRRPPPGAARRGPRPARHAARGAAGAAGAPRAAPLRRLVTPARLSASPFPLTQGPRA